MLKLLRAAVLNHGSHRLERAILRLRQTAQVAASHSPVVPPTRAEKMAMAIEKSFEPRGDLLDQRCGESPIHPHMRLPDELTTSFRLQIVDELFAQEVRNRIRVKTKIMALKA